LFDPALRHYSRAFRPGDPTFADSTDAQRWADARRRATDHVLRAIAESPLGEKLILRGSRLLRSWCGAAAREPGDLDYLVDPPTIGMGDPWAERLADTLTAAVIAKPNPEGVEFLREGIESDDIWTYERAPGRRIVFPWRSVGLPGGSVQVDAVFGEALSEPARMDAIPSEDGGCIVVRQSSPAQSLAWKLVWLETDTYPQGKDLYDAVLLAERFPLSRNLLTECLRRVELEPPSGTATEFVRRWNVDWVTFLTEYPWVEGDKQAWLNRMAAAIEPTFRDEILMQVLPELAELPSQWLTATVVALARGIRVANAYDRLPILADALEEAGCDDEAILLHCRREGRHSAGCWVIDHVLGLRES
jgi:hypothetical protein